MVHHHGGIDYGHYTATVRHANTGLWYQADDETVALCTPAQLRPSPSAYLLFYELRG